jgi:hypothetical protein
MLTQLLKPASSKVDYDEEIRHLREQEAEGAVINANVWLHESAIFRQSMYCFWGLNWLLLE